MAQDKSKKTSRHFQCRDYLWELFEQMSAELECSTDYLINEAMRQYARSRNYASSRSGTATLRHPTGTYRHPKSSLPPLSGAPPRRSVPPSFPQTPPPDPRGRGRLGATAAGPSMAPTLSPDQEQSPPPLQATYGTSSLAGRPQQLSEPALPPRNVGTRRPPLYVIFQNRRLPVTKDDFMIGRGSKTADLSIKDGNISRRHAKVLYQDGGYYIKDLGSTNGIEYRGQRIDIKRIEEGDVFSLCDYELRFTFQ